MVGTPSEEGLETLITLVVHSVLLSPACPFAVFFFALDPGDTRLLVLGSSAAGMLLFSGRLFLYPFGFFFSGRSDALHGVFSLVEGSCDAAFNLFRALFPP